MSVKLQKGNRSKGKYQDHDSGFEKLEEMSEVGDGFSGMYLKFIS